MADAVEEPGRVSSWAIRLSPVAVAERLRANVTTLRARLIAVRVIP